MIGNLQNPNGPAWGPVRQAQYVPSAVQQHTLIQRVCYLLATGLGVSAMGAWLFRDIGQTWYIAFFVALGLLFVLKAVARTRGVNVLVFYLFCVAEGAMLGPLLSSYIRFLPNGASLVWEAFLLTAVTVAGVGTYSYTSGRDFGFLGRGLVWALVGLIIFGLASMFVVSMHTPLVALGYEAIIVVVFTGFLLYDFSNIRLKYSPEDYTIAAVQVYLDFLNIFLAILNILAMLQGGGGSSRRR